MHGVKDSAHSSGAAHLAPRSTPTWQIAECIITLVAALLPVRMVLSLHTAKADGAWVCLCVCVRACACLHLRLAQPAKQHQPTGGKKEASRAWGPDPHYSPPWQPNLAGPTVSRPPPLPVVLQLYEAVQLSAPNARDRQHTLQNPREKAHTDSTILFSMPHHRAGVPSPPAGRVP